MPLVRSARSPKRSRWSPSTVVSWDSTRQCFTSLKRFSTRRTVGPHCAILLMDRIRERFDPQWEEMIQLARGRCYEALWDETKAGEAYNLAILTNEKSVIPRLASASLRLKRHPEEAILELERALVLIPNDPALQVALAGAILRGEAAKPKGGRSFAESDRAWKDAKGCGIEYDRTDSDASRPALDGREGG